MLSFQKDESKVYMWMYSSVVDDDKDYYSPRRTWPFEWDWNGLFCHDFPLLDLPDNVLIEALQMLSRDDRWNLSLSCDKLRRLILDEEMDRRPTLDTVEIKLNESEVRVVDEDEDFGYQNKFEFEDLPSFEKVIKNAVSPWYYQQANVTIDSLPNCLVGVPNAIEYLVYLVAGWTDRITLCGPKQPSDDVVKQMVEAFVRDPDLVQQVAFGDPDDRDMVPERWEEYCTTVTEWANARGLKVRRVLAADIILQIENWGFGLIDDYRNGDMYWVVEIIDFVNGKPDESTDDEDSESEELMEMKTKVKELEEKIKRMKEKMRKLKQKMEKMKSKITQLDGDPDSDDDDEEEDSESDDDDEDSESDDDDDEEDSEADDEEEEEQCCGVSDVSSFLSF